MSAALPLNSGAEPGFGPQWWDSGTRTRWWWAGLVVSLGLVVADAVLNLASGVPAQNIAISLAGELAEITIGLLFWMWRGNAIGPLVVAYVVLSLIPDLASGFPQSRLAWTLFYPGVWLWQGLWAWMLLAFPSGRLWNRASAYLVIYMTAFLTLVPLVQELFRSAPPTYLYLGHGWSGIDRYTWFYGIDAILIWLPFAGFLVARVVRTAPGARRRIVPLYAAAGYHVLFNVPLFAYWTLTASSFVAGSATDLPSWWAQGAGLSGVGFCLSAVGAAFGLARVRQKRSVVTDLVVDFGQVDPGKVRETLARALGDPDLVLGLWLHERGAWVDEDGSEFALPSDNRRAVTYVGDRLAVMVHHPDLLDQPRLLEAVGSAGRLALENERLHAALRAQLAELSESRARIVRSADEERRRLERDLHDGAQQRLLALGMALQLLRSRVDGDGGALLAEAESELQQALSELRELARGIHPAVLVDQGLDAAVRTLAARAAVPVEVVSEGDRLPMHVETAAYFVVAEALANVAKYAQARHARVTIRHDNNEALIEVRDDGIGGARPGAGSGLIGLADRVGAIGGRLTVDSPVGGGTSVQAVIPCLAAVAEEASEPVGRPVTAVATTTSVGA
jgi:signal transduction histidine kinase